MTGARLNQINAAVFAVVQSLIPALILLGVVSWTSDTIAAVMLVVSNTLTLVGLLFAQSPSTNTPEAPAERGSIDVTTVVVLVVPLIIVLILVGRV